MADYSKYGQPAPEWTEFVKNGHFKPAPDGLSLQERRDFLNTRRAKLHREEYGARSEDVVVEELSIPTQDKASIPARLYRPRASIQNSNSKLPLIIHLHSGGWHLGNLDTEDPFCAYLTAALYKQKSPGFAILNANYRHTPEHHFPTQLNDAYAALEYFTTGSAAGKAPYSIDTEKVYLSGTSAGAHLAIGCTIQDIQRRLESGQANSQSRIHGLILSCPPAVHPDLFPYNLLSRKEISSYVQCANDPALGVAMVQKFWGLYLPSSLTGDEGERHAAKAQSVLSPLVTSEDVFTPDLWPPTSVHVAGMDCLRDEALLFEEKLKTKGIKTRLHVYGGFPHAFNLLPQLGESKKWREDLLNDILEIDSFI